MIKKEGSLKVYRVINVNRLGQINEIQAVRLQPMPLSPSCFRITTDQNQNLQNVSNWSDDLKAYHPFCNKVANVWETRFHFSFHKQIDIFI